MHLQPDCWSVDPVISCRFEGLFVHCTVCSTMSCPSGGRLSTSPRSIWAFCTACILVLMVPIRACWAELWVYRKINRFISHRLVHILVETKLGWGVGGGDWKVKIHLATKERLVCAACTFKLTESAHREQLGLPAVACVHDASDPLWSAVEPTAWCPCWGTLCRWSRSGSPPAAPLSHAPPGPHD